MSRPRREDQRMIEYEITGSLPAPWEDFYSNNQGSPNVTIITEANRQSFDPASEECNGWIVIFIEGDLLTEERAKEELAKVNKVAPDQITILMEGFAQAS